MRNDELPTVNINDLNYRIKLTDKEDGNIEKNWGMIHYDKLMILLDKNISPERRVKVFFHEIAHGMVEETSFNDALENQLGEEGLEIFVDRLGDVLEKLIRNNDFKQLVNYVRNGEVKTSPVTMDTNGWNCSNEEVVTMD